MLNRILVGQQDIEEMLAAVKRHRAPSRKPLPEGMPQLPLKTEAEIHELEQWLLVKTNICSLQYACMKCKNALSPIYDHQERMITNVEYTASEWTCTICGTNKHVKLIDLPYVYHYLFSELAAVNVKIRLKIGNFL